VPSATGDRRSHVRAIGEGAHRGRADRGPMTPAPVKPTPRRRRWLRRIATAAAALIAAACASLAIAVFGWSYDLADLDRRGPLILLDRAGRELRSVPAPGARPARSVWVELSDLPAIAISAVVHSEDEHYFDHPG